MMLWSLPAALEGKDFSAPTKPGGKREKERMIRDEEEKRMRKDTEVKIELCNGEATNAAYDAQNCVWVCDARTKVTKFDAQNTLPSDREKIIDFLMSFRISSSVCPGRPMSELARPLRRYAGSGEINFKVENKEAKMEELARRYSEGQIDHLDGVTIGFKEWWFNCRPSNTEPLLRLNVEAKSKRTVG
jgi:hypothetical protein